MRMLMMFGPMIFRQFQKYQRNKQRQAPQQGGYNQGGNQQRNQGNQQQGNQYDRQGQQGNQQQGNQYDNRQGNQQQSPIQDNQPRQEYKDLNAELKAQGKGSEKMQEQEDFNLKESDIMLTKEELKHAKMEAEMLKANNPGQNDLDIEDIFKGKGK